MSSRPPICHRTQAVLRLLTLPHRRYAAFVSGSDDGSAEQHVVNAYLANLLKKYSRQIMEKVEEVEGLVVQSEEEEVTDTRRETRKAKERRESRGGDGRGGNAKVLPEQKDVLVRRWVQIRELVNGAVSALGG